MVGEIGGGLPESFVSGFRMGLVCILGTGQCGLPAVVDVLNRQPGCQFTCQAWPLLPWKRSARPLLKARLERMIRDYTAPIFGDAASSFLPYVEELFQLHPDARVICMRRPRAEVAGRFLQYLANNWPLPINHWTKVPAAGWSHDPVWSRTYPQYDATNLEADVRRYCDDYDYVTTEYARRWPRQFQVFDPEVALDTADGLRELLDFADIPRSDQVLCTGRWRALPEPDLRRDRPMAPRTEHPDDPRRCVILVPYNTHIHLPCDEALKELERRGYPVRRVYGYAAIDQARNQLATDALVDGYAETLWIDSDIGFHPDAVDQIRSHHVPVCAGMYAQKGKRALASHALPGTAEIVLGKSGGLLEILYAATGFLHVRREVYLRIQEHLQLPVCNERFGNPLIPFFQPHVQEVEDGNWYLAEDFSFSQRMREAGFPVYCDTSIRLWHYGIYPYGWEDAGGDVNRSPSYRIGLGGTPPPEETDA